MFKHLAIIITVIFAATSAWAQADQTGSRTEETRLVEPEEGYGMVYVVRAAGKQPHHQYHVYLDRAMDENRIGYTRGGQYIYFTVEPGRHELISVALNTRTIRFEIEPGETVFICQNEQIDLRAGSNQASLEILHPEPGAYLVDHLAPGWMDREHPRS